MPAKLSAEKIQPIAEMRFPASSSNTVKARYLVLRNNTKTPLIAKVRPSCTQLLKVDPQAGYVKPGDSIGFRILLDPSQCKFPRRFSDHYLSVYCRPFNASKSAELKEWQESDSAKDTELAQKLHIKVAKELVPPATVLELPASAVIVDSVRYATTGVDDNDTVTAHEIASETKTAAVIQDNDFLMLVPDSQVGTAHGIDEGARTARNINDQSCWMFEFLDGLFPSAGADTTGICGGAS